MKLSKWLYAFPIISVASLLGITIMFLTHQDIKLELIGTKVNSEKPTLEIGEILKGDYQSDYDKWFAENFPLRTYLVKGYNQIQYSLFNTSPNLNVIKAKNGHLMEYTYIKEYLGLDQIDGKVESYNTIYKIYDLYARKLKIVQDELERQGKTFFYIITPSKAEVYPEEVPERYILAAKNLETSVNHKILIEVLTKYGIHFYDTVDTMKTIKAEGEFEAFPNTGTHWNYYAAARATKDIFEAVYKQTGVKLATPQISVGFQEDFTGQDQDIYNLCNLFKGLTDEHYLKVDVQYNFLENTDRPKAVLFGTSFNEQLAHIFQSGEGAFEEYTFFRYLQYKARYVEGMQQVVSLNKRIDCNQIGETVDQSDIVFIESNATDLVEAHMNTASYLAKYLQGEVQEIPVLLTTEDTQVNPSVKVEKLDVKVGENVQIPIKIENNTTCRLSGNTFNPICFTPKYVNKATNEMIQVDWQMLKEDIMPGDSQEIELSIKAPEEPGEYTLEVNLLQVDNIQLDHFNAKYPICIDFTVN